MKRTVYASRVFAHPKEFRLTVVGEPLEIVEDYVAGYVERGLVVLEDKSERGAPERAVEGPAVENKASVDPNTPETLEAPSRASDSLSAVSKSGNWFHLSDGTKVLGWSQLAEKLGVTVEEAKERYGDLVND